MRASESICATPEVDYVIGIRSTTDRVGGPVVVSARAHILWTTRAVGMVVWRRVCVCGQRTAEVELSQREGGCGWGMRSILRLASRVSADGSDEEEQEG